MGKTIWFTMTSLDGFITDRRHNINFHTPSEEVHRYINTLNESNTVMILDRDGYEIMKYWDDPTENDLQYEVVRVYAEQWKYIKKIIVGDIGAIEEKNYTLWNEVTAERIDTLLANESGDIIIGSSPLAWELIRLKKLNEIQMIIVPILLGDGVKNYKDSGEVPLELIDHEIFENGWTYLHYKVINSI